MNKEQKVIREILLWSSLLLSIFAVIKTLV